MNEGNGSDGVFRCMQILGCDDLAPFILHCYRGNGSDSNSGSSGSNGSNGSRTVITVLLVVIVVAVRRHVA